MIPTLSICLQVCVILMTHVSTLCGLMFKTKVSGFQFLMMHKRLVIS